LGSGLDSGFGVWGWGSGFRSPRTRALWRSRVTRRRVLGFGFMRWASGSECEVYSFISSEFKGVGFRDSSSKGVGFP